MPDNFRLPYPYKETSSKTTPATTPSNANQQVLSQNPQNSFAAYSMDLNRVSPMDSHSLQMTDVNIEPQTSIYIPTIDEIEESRVTPYGPLQMQDEDTTYLTSGHGADTDNDSVLAQPTVEMIEDRPPISQTRENPTNSIGGSLIGTSGGQPQQTRGSFPNGSNPVVDESTPLIDMFPHNRLAFPQGNTDVGQGRLKPNSNRLPPPNRRHGRGKARPVNNDSYAIQMSDPTYDDDDFTPRRKRHFFSRRMANMLNWFGIADDPWEPVLEATTANQQPADILLDMGDENELEEYRVQLLRENPRNPEGPILRRESLIDRGFQPEEPTVRYRQRNLYGCLMRTMEEMLKLSNEMKDYAEKAKYASSTYLRTHYRDCEEVVGDLIYLLDIVDELEKDEPRAKQVQLKKQLDINQDDAAYTGASWAVSYLAEKTQVAVKWAKIQLSLEPAEQHGTPRPPMRLTQLLGESKRNDGVYLGSVEGKHEVVKVKYSAQHPNSLTQEYALYMALHRARAPNIPGVHGYVIGQDNLHSLRLQALGMSLDHIRQYKMGGAGFSDVTICMLAVQVLVRLMDLHHVPSVPGSPDGKVVGFFVHGNVTPKNLVMGKARDAQTLYLVDFGLAARYQRGYTMVDDRPPDANGKRECPLGTPLYASLADHRGKMLHPRDDLENLGYTLMDLSASVKYGHKPGQASENPHKIPIKKTKFRESGYKQLKKEFPALGSMMVMATSLPVGRLSVGYYKEMISMFQTHLAQCGEPPVYDWMKTTTTTA